MGEEKIIAKAVILGVLVDWGGTLLATLVLGVALGVVMAVQGNYSPSYMEKAIIFPSLVIGFGFTLLGGYIAGRTARQAHLLHGALVGAIGLLLSLLLYLFRPSLYASFPLWYNVLSFAGIIPIAMAGGHLAGRRAKRNECAGQSGSTGCG